MIKNNGGVLHLSDLEGLSAKTIIIKCPDLPNTEAPFTVDGVPSHMRVEILQNTQIKG
jgi:hypothetical protein